MQAPLQGLLFASNAAALLRSCHGSAADVLQVMNAWGRLHAWAFAVHEAAAWLLGSR